MFTGLVQAKGTLDYLGSHQLQITYHPDTNPQIFQDLVPGDSVAVDGMCLTVVTILTQGFVAEMSPETMQRTTLQQQEHADAQVNLETSLRVGSKVGGHFVTGHVDGVGYLQSVEQTATSWELGFRVSASAIARYIVPKGSIAVNGVSLTVADCNPSGTWFKVAVIPHTYLHTNLQTLKPGDPVNLEGDLLGKYVEKFLHLGTNASHDLGTPDSINTLDALTPEFLVEHGYI
jgi:riboflavin synthase